jgi:hypothetical protein
MSILFQRSFAAVATGFVMLASAQSHADSVPPPNLYCGYGVVCQVPPPGYAGNGGANNPYVPFPGYSGGSAPYVAPQTNYVPPQTHYVRPQIAPGLIGFGRLPQTQNCLGCGFGQRLQQQVRPGYISFGRLPGH